MKKYPEKFTVQVTVGEYDENIYTEPENCYLAKAIKTKYPDARVVVTCSSTEIDGINYETVEGFNAEYAKANQNSTFPITLKRI